jgi:5-methylcytosine-specific restriction endonuclease McrA
MNDYIKDWIYVIRNCSVDNTYKMSWGKSLVECCFEDPSNKVISFDRISIKMFKYYWNQTIFFDLQQSPNPIKPPELYTYVKQEIKQYQERYGYKPILYDRVEKKLKIDVNRINKILKKDVCYRFLKLDGKDYDLYELDRKNELITVKEPEQLKEYGDVLLELINYRWTQILENFNSSPRISKKVRIIDIDDISRNSLTKFQNYLDVLEPNCFICREGLLGNQSIDHVIPWSYLYSDDLWNLVYTHPNCNSSKSNRIVDEEVIKELEKRNKELLEELYNLGINDKHTEELQLSINRDYVRKFWIGFKG